MDAPKCKLCGKRHYGFCPTAGFRTDDIVETADEVLVITATLPKTKPRFDRVAYQREYMRTHRAKAKEGREMKRTARQDRKA